MPSCPSSVRLVLTRTVDAVRLTSDQYVYMTSCSRSPVIRKNSYQSRSSSSHLRTTCRVLHARKFPVPLREARPVVLAGQATNPGAFRKTSHSQTCCTRYAGLVLLITQERGELQQVLTIDFVEIELVADSTKYARAVEYAARVFGFFVSLFRQGNRNGCRY